MRSLAPIAKIGSLIVASGIQAQSLSEHAAAAAGATIGTAAGKPLSNAITKIFNNVDDNAQKAAKNPSKPLTKPESETKSAKPPATGAIVNAGPPVSGGGSGSTQPSSGSRRRTPRSESAVNEPVAPPTFTIVPIAPPVKQASAEELALIKVGTTEQELVAALGRPYSRITIPEEGHMLETYQYRANGKPLATIRLDNGQVVTIEPSEN
jgi:hypothetical protein